MVSHLSLQQVKNVFSQHRTSQYIHVFKKVDFKSTLENNRDFKMLLFFQVILFCHKAETLYVSEPPAVGSRHTSLRH